MKRNLPNLLIVGAAKSGTTSLHNYLNEHPDIHMCSPKEPHFLINKEIGVDRISNGIKSLKDYESLFLQSEQCKYIGESSVMYLMYPEIVIPKIKKMLGLNTRIIIMLRNPVERAYSGFNHVKRYNNKEDKSFEIAWQISEERYFNDPKMTPASRYKKLGMYYNQVKSFLDELTNVHVIIYDDYTEDFHGEMKKLFSFLNVHYIEIDNSMRHMVGGWQWRNNKIKSLMMGNNFIKKILKLFLPKYLRRIIREIIQDINTSPVSKINLETEIMLKDFYKDDVNKLSKLLNRDLNFWTR